jgi:phosphatidate cytidylyltransferase
MLKQRVITALVLLAVLLPVLFAERVAPFSGLTLLAVAAAGWEWARLNGKVGAPAWGLGAVVLIGGLLLWPSATGGALSPLLWWAAMLIWVLGGSWALRGGVSAWPRLPAAARLLLGVLMLWLAWAAIVQAKVRGVEFLLSVLCLVWAADIAAYFGGRAFGRRKLALAISPGKSWEGAWSGMAAVGVLALAWNAYDSAKLGSAGTTEASGSVFWHMRMAWGWTGLVLGAVFLTAMSVVGDLFESLVKRAAGAKDSSNLLPGHGGVLDRVDALLPVFPLALALAGGPGGLR